MYKIYWPGTKNMKKFSTHYIQLKETLLYTYSLYFDTVNIDLV